jgi:hypothetical protein
MRREVGGGTPKNLFVVLQKPQADVAVVAEKPSDFARGVIVVDDQSALRFGLVSLATDAATPMLRRVHLVVLILRELVRLAQPPTAQLLLPGTGPELVRGAHGHAF